VILQYAVSREQFEQYLQNNFIEISVFQGVFKTVVVKAYFIIKWFDLWLILSMLKVVILEYKVCYE
jgi:hypothetical protein